MLPERYLFDCLFGIFFGELRSVLPSPSDYKLKMWVRGASSRSVWEAIPRECIKAGCAGREGYSLHVLGI